MSEIHFTVISMKNNKAPGSDGVSAEFFKVFFNSESSISSQNDPN
jgi:hypothetical protein